VPAWACLVMTNAQTQAGTPAHREVRAMDENGPQSVFDTSRDQLEHEESQPRAKSQGQTLT